MKQLIAVLLMLVGLSAQPALSQAWDGPGAQPVIYNTHQIGDGTTPYGGTPPANALAPADRPTQYDTTGFTFSVTKGVDTAANEIKFRIVCGTSHSNWADFILAPGVPKWMHKHSYAGNRSTDYNSTYQTLRDHKFSTCQGGPLWNQPYWEPSLCKMVGSTMQCVKSDFHLFYYARGAEFKGKLVSLPNDTHVIFGKNPFDMNNDARKGEIPPNYSGPFDGFKGWMCAQTTDGGDVTQVVQTADGKDYSMALETPTHGDPWSGQCKAGYRMTAELIAPDCWDGKNTHSPNGRDHFRYKSANTAVNAGKGYCPDNWYDVPDLSVRVSFSLKKDAEYHQDQWFLSSDRMNADPTKWELRGSTMHADWAQTVDPDVWKRVMSQCLAIAFPGYTPLGGDCGTGNIDMTTSLNGGNPPAGSGYPTPITSSSQRRLLSAKDRWFPIETGSKGPFHIMGH